MGDKGYSTTGLFGTITHYDEKGHKTGTSEPGIFGGYTNYDEKGHVTGHSEPGFFGGYTHYDSSGSKTGRTDPGLFGGYDHYDSTGKKTGHSEPGVFGGYSNSSDGCYVATCVYGSYDCPEVWTLRRFRDNVLRKSVFGRAFVRVYYRFSPSLVARRGDSYLFRSFCKKRLDRLVRFLNSRGIENTRYGGK